MYLVGGHRERMDVTVLRRVAVREAKLWWIQQFWSHVTGESRLGCCHVVSLHDIRIGDNRRNSKVSDARVTLLSDKDISLDRLGIGELVHCDACI